MESQQPEPKISIPLAIALTFLYAILDIFSGIPALNWITAMAAAVINFFIARTGIGGTVLVFTYVVEFVIEMIPAVSILPMMTIAWIFTVVIDHYPQALPERLRAKIEQAGEIAQAVEGKGMKGGGPQKALQTEGKAAQEAAAVRSGTEMTGKNLEDGTTGAAGEAAQGGSIDGGTRSSGRQQGAGREVPPGEEGEVQDREEGSKGKTPSPAELHGQRMMEGRHIEDLEERLLGSGQLEEDIGASELGAKSSRFNPDEMGPEMTTKPVNIPKTAPRSAEGYNDSAANDNEEGEQIDLRNRKAS